MKKLRKKYSTFLKEMNKQRVNWCLIKDIKLLASKGYDNEIDLITENKYRSKIRRIGRELGWKESTLNNFNTHLIFFQFEGLKPFRIDIHVGRTLATAVPWFKAKKVLAEKEKIGDIYIVSPRWELAILLLSSFRGRAPKKHRIARAKALKTYLSKTAELFKGELREKEVEKYYRALVQGKKVKFSKMQRLGLLNFIREQFLHSLLFLTRLFNPSPAISLKSDNKAYRKKVLEKLYETLANAKINVKTAEQKTFWKRVTSDVVLVQNNKSKKIRLNPKKSVDKSVEEVIRKIW